MDSILRTHQPKYILANASSLDFANEFTHPFSIDLLEADVETLKSNYVRFWGPIYVPGKTLSSSGEFTTPATLIWGDNLTAPEEVNVPDYMFFGL